MAEKQTILGRIAQLAKANINALLDKAEDPQKMIDQLVRDYTNSIVEAENAIAQTLGNLRMAEKDYEEDVKYEQQKQIQIRHSIIWRTISIYQHLLLLLLGLLGFLGLPPHHAAEDDDHDDNRVRLSHPYYLRVHR